MWPAIIAVAAVAVVGVGAFTVVKKKRSK